MPVVEPSIARAQARQPSHARRRKTALHAARESNPLGDLGMRFAQLRHKRKLRFRKLYKSPDKTVVYMFVGTVIFGIILFWFLEHITVRTSCQIVFARRLTQLASRFPLPTCFPVPTEAREPRGVGARSSGDRFARGI